MKTEDQIKNELAVWWNNLRVADSIEEAKFYQGNINALLYVLTDEKVEQRMDGFEGEIKEKKE